MRLITLIITFFSPFAIIAQQTSVLEAKGKIPTDFITPTLKKIEYSNTHNKNSEKFNEQIHFSIDRILQSGQVIFNDTISNYITKVYDEICKHNPDVPRDVRLYTVKSDVTNAFTTQQGIIFVNVGLLARLENEAQLAFILCHELVHYMKQHVMQGYETDQELKENNMDYRTVKNVDNVVASNRFSRKMETEADKEGIELFLNTNYNPKEIEAVFNILLYSYLPYSKEPFDSSIVIPHGQTIPLIYFKTNLDKIDAEEDVEDYKHTHPNVAKRKKLAKYILGDSVSAKQNFVFPEEEFEYIRNISQQTIIEIQIRNTRYSRALYHTSILKPENTSEKVTEIIYGTSILANAKKRKKVVGYYKYQQGPAQQAYYMLSKLKSKELAFISARNLWNCLESNPENLQLQNKLYHTFTDIIYHYNVGFDEIQFDTNPQIKVDNSKWEYALFSDCKCEDELKLYFDSAQTLSKARQLENATTNDDKKNEELKEEQRKQAKELKKNGYALGLDNIILVEPQFTGVNANEDALQAYQVIDTEKNREWLLNNVTSIGNNHNISVQPLSMYQIREGQVDKFNDIALLSNWFDERFTFQQYSNYISTSNEAQNLVKKYGTPYFAWSGVMWTVSPKTLHYSYMVVFNLETGELLMYQEREKKGVVNSEIVHEIYTDFFKQISKSAQI